MKLIQCHLAHSIMDRVPKSIMDESIVGLDLTLIPTVSHQETTMNPLSSVSLLRMSLVQFSGYFYLFNTSRAESQMI